MQHRCVSGEYLQLKTYFNNTCHFICKFITNYTCLVSYSMTLWKEPNDSILMCSLRVLPHLLLTCARPAAGVSKRWLPGPSERCSPQRRPYGWSHYSFTNELLTVTRHILTLTHQKRTVTKKLYTFNPEFLKMTDKLHTPVYITAKGERIFLILNRILYIFNQFF